MHIEINTLHAKDGTPIIELISDDKSYRMNSIYKPHDEAVKFASKFSDIDDNTVLLVFGFGNGIFPDSIMKMCEERKIKLIFYEPSEDLMEYIGHNYDISSLSVMDNVYFLSHIETDEKIGFYNISEFALLLESLITYANYRNVVSIALPRYIEIFPSEYKEFDKQIQYRIHRLKSNVMTAKDMGYEAVVNNIQNLRYISDSYCADSFVGVFPADMPAIIVSAGPSLEKNVRVLKGFKNKALILCVDTAAAYLIKENIIPDMIICVDAVKPLSMFEDDRLLGIPIAVGTDVNYKVLDRMKTSPIIFATTENPYIQSLYRIGGHTIDKLKSGGSVANLAFSLCIYWGFQNIILVGQDLALSNDQMYVGNIENTVVPDSVLRKKIDVEDIYGNTIYTYNDYYSYLMWFEQEIAANPQINVIDATEGGAMIHGTTITTLQAICDKYGNNNCDVDVLSLYKNAPLAFDAYQKKGIGDRIRASKETLANLRERLEYGIDISKQAIRLLQMDDIDTDQIVRLEKEMKEICMYYDSLEEGFLIQRMIDATDLEAFMMIFDQKAAASRQEQYSRMKLYFECLLRALKPVESEWANIQSMEQYDPL